MAVRMSTPSSTSPAEPLGFGVEARQAVNREAGLAGVTDGGRITCLSFGANRLAYRAGRHSVPRLLIRKTLEALA
jgi:hypothetical protein